MEVTVEPVTVETVIERLSFLESLYARGVGTAVKSQQFEIACLRELLALLESRSVAVKLPERYACELGYNAPDPSGDMLALDDVLAMLADAGIKLEAGDG